MKKYQLLAAALASACMSSPLIAQSFDVAEPVFVQNQVSTNYIVRFKEPGLMYNVGQLRGIAATAPSATGARKLQANTPVAASYRAILRQQQDAYVASINSKLGRSTRVTHYYDVTMSGLSVQISAGEVAKLLTLEGVVSVEPAGVYEINSDAGPTWIGASAIWDGTGTISGIGTRGQGVIVGVFDSGANQDHPSFSNDAACGFSTFAPKVIGFKDCAATACTGPDPEDTSAASGGHGVHTASTAAGNALVPPLNVAGVDLKWPISGVAPCAKVITYKVCGSNNCDGAAIQAAINQSIVDQVDVVNFSISGGIDPWSDNDRGFLDMVNGDILVAASSGNTRAAPNDNPIGTVNHRGPWVLTVANSTHDRVEANFISVAGSLQNRPGTPAAGAGLTGTQVISVVTGASLGNNFGCNDTGAFAAGSMTGKVALMQRGPLNGATPACAFTEKMQNAANAGAVAAIIFNHSPGPLLSMAAGAVPGYFVGKPVGEAWVAALANNPNAQATIVSPAQRINDPVLADILNGSSLRGPNIIGSTTVGNFTFIGADTTKPDITAPGTNIYAAVSDVAGQFGFLTGTSMSSPHIAGAAALVRAVNPNWSVTEVKSALQMTANSVHLKADEATRADPDDIGNGRADLSRAAKVGIVMNETFANFAAANPATQLIVGDQAAVRALNLPNYRNTDCTAGVCTFTRTFRNTSSTPRTWKVLVDQAPAGTVITAIPATFSFAGLLTETQTVSFTVRITQPGGLPLPVAPAQRSPKFGVIALAPVLPLPPAPVGTIFASNFEDAPLGVPLVITVGIAGPQAL